MSLFIEQTLDAPRPWHADLGRRALRAATLAALLVLLLLVARRLSGAYQPLPAFALVAIGCTAAFAAWAWRKLWRQCEGEGRWQRRVERWFPALALVLLVLALSIAGTSTSALVLFWLVIVGEEIWTGVTTRRATTSHRETRREVPRLSPLPSEAPEIHLHDILPAGVSQQITRTVQGETESLECLLRAHFEPGEQNLTLHVAFCPPLLFPPTATCAPLTGAACEIKLAEIEPYGARLEIKRPRAMQLADDAIVQLRVTSTPTAAT